MTGGMTSRVRACLLAAFAEWGLSFYFFEILLFFFYFYLFNIFVRGGGKVRSPLFLLCLFISSFSRFQFFLLLSDGLILEILKDPLIPKPQTYPLFSV